MTDEKELGTPTDLDHRDGPGDDRRQPDGGEADLPGVSTRQRYRRARELAGLSIAQAVKLLGFGDRKSLENFEARPGRRVSDACERAMAGVYGCSLEYLTGQPCAPPVEAARILRDLERSVDRESILEALSSL